MDLIDGFNDPVGDEQDDQDQRRLLGAGAHAGNAFEMAIDAFLAAFLRPSAVAVHDDGYVYGQFLFFFHTD